VQKPTLRCEGERLFVGPRHRWEDNIEMDLTGMGCESVNPIKLAENGHQRHAVMNSVIKLRVL
jgi:hypothetical protein